MRILLFGKYGQLGYELNRCLIPLGDVIAFDKEDIDFTEPHRISEKIQELMPDIIVNAAAYTAVDQAESEEQAARLINAVSPGVIAEEAKKRNALLVHYSTDYVFDGTKGKPYTEEDIPNPINVYGRTKLEGERAVCEVGGLYFIFRTSWLYSIGMPSFPTKVMEWARNQEELQVVDDQIGSPTWARYLAEMTSAVLNTSRALSSNWMEEKCGLYHLTGGGSVSRYKWALKILDLDLLRSEHIVEEVIPVKSVEFRTLAERPPNTSLTCQKFELAFNMKIHSWDEILKLAMER